MNGPCQTKTRHLHRTGIPESELADFLDQLDDEGWTAEYECEVELAAVDRTCQEPTYTVTGTREICACKAKRSK